MNRKYHRRDLTEIFKENFGFFLSEVNQNLWKQNRYFLLYEITFLRRKIMYNFADIYSENIW